MKVRTSFAIGCINALLLTASGLARAEAPPADKRAEAPPADQHAEPAITATGVEGNYLRAVHGQVHRRWADNFLRLAETLPPGNPINDLGRITEAEVIISADGQTVTVKLSKP